MIAMAPCRILYIVKPPDTLSQCAWCGAWQTTAGWLGGGPLVHTLHLEGEQAGEYHVSHAICPSCYRLVMAEYHASRSAVRAGMGPWCRSSSVPPWPW